MGLHFVVAYFLGELYSFSFPFSYFEFTTRWCYADESICPAEYITYSRGLSVVNYWLGWAQKGRSINY